MPIDYKNYPPDWKERRKRILKRAKNKCEICGAKNHKPNPKTGSKVILTIAHLDNDSENWDVPDDRLMAMCQRCHLNYDRSKSISRKKYGLKFDGPQQLEIFNPYQKNLFGEKIKQKIAPSKILTKEFLEKKYFIEQKSLDEIAKETNCSKQFVKKIMKKFGINCRTRSEARNLALNKNKLVFIKKDENFNLKRIQLQKIKINENFFKINTPEMLYVLGIIFTDGCLVSTKYKNYERKTFSIAQKNTELLYKIKNLMNCSAKIYYQNKNANKLNPIIYSIQINNNEVYNDLLKFGLTPNKSLIIKFPNLEENLIRHFIRGCWDGDGHVNYNNASIISGSINFIKKIEFNLNLMGFLKKNIYKTTHTKNPCYFIRYNSKECAYLFYYLYNNVPESQYLKRKYDLFKFHYEKHSTPLFPLKTINYID